MSEIAEIMGVDKSTVSRALNDNKRISKKVRTKIQSLAKKYNYYRNASAYSLRKKINQSIAVVIKEYNFISSSYFQEIIHGINNVIQKHSFALILTLRSETNDSFLKFVFENRIDGAIIIGNILSEKDLSKLKQRNFPICNVGYMLSDEIKRLINIYNNNEYAGELLGEHIINICKRRNILFLRRGNETQDEQFFKGLQKAIYQSIQKGLYIYFDAVDIGINSSESDIIEKINCYMKKFNFKFDAVLSISNIIASYARDVLNRNQIKVPDDVIIIPYDNFNPDNFFHIKPENNNDNPYLIGMQAAETVLNNVKLKMYN